MKNKQYNTNFPRLLRMGTALAGGWLLILLFVFSSFAQDTKTWSFAASAESWTFTSGGKATGAYDGTEQALDMNSLGRNNSDVSYWTWTGTWEDMGVTAGNTVYAVTANFDWKCYAANVSDGYTHGPFQIYTSDGITLIDGGSGTTGSGTTGSYATQQTALTISSTYEASSTTVQLRLSITLDNGNNASAETGLYYDNIELLIYSNEASTPTRRIFIIN